MSELLNFHLWTINQFKGALISGSLYFLAASNNGNDGKYLFKSVILELNNRIGFYFMINGT